MLTVKRFIVFSERHFNICPLPTNLCLASTILNVRPAVCGPALGEGEFHSTHLNDILIIVACRAEIAM